MDNPRRSHYASLLAASLCAATFAGTPFISLQFLGRSSPGGYDVSAAEIAAYDPATSRAFVVNALTASVEIMDLSIPSAPSRVGSFLLRNHRTATRWCWWQTKSAARCQSSR